MSKIEEVTRKIYNFLEQYKSKYYEDSYEEYICKGEEEICLEDLLCDFIKTIPEVEDYAMAYIGGFESVGYEISCNSLAFTVEGKLNIIPINYER